MNITYTEVRNPKWANAGHTQVDCEVNFTHLPEEFVPFTADPNDIYPYCKEIFDRCVSGEFGPVAEYVPPVEPTQPTPGV